MPTGETSAPRPLLATEDERVFGEVQAMLAPWGVAVDAADQDEALRHVEHATARVVLVLPFAGVRLYCERLRAAGAVPVVLALHHEPSESLEGLPAVQTPYELVAQVFRAQGQTSDARLAAFDRVNTFAQIIATQFSLPELTRMAIAKSRELTQADGASLLLIDQATGELYFDVVAGSGDGTLDRVRLARGKGIAGRIALEARPRLVSDVAQCEDFDRSADMKSGFRTGSVIGAPLVVAGDVLGVLMAVRSATSRPFTPLELDQLVNLTPHVAIAVHNAQITTQLRQSQAQVLQVNQSLEQKVAERTQQISRAKAEWERTFDAIAEPIVLLDGFTIRRANAAFARRVQLKLQEVPGKVCHKLLAGRDQPCAGCPLLKARTESVSEVDVLIPGEKRKSLLRASAHWMSDDPHEKASVMQYQDVTQARQLQDRLRESERLVAVGQLASGAAHEINNPLGFLTSNLRTLRGLLDELKEPVRSLTQALTLVNEGRLAELSDVLNAAGEVDAQAIEDGAEMIDESLDGARRVGEIVKGLRELSRLEVSRREPANVNASVSRAVRTELGEAGNLVLELEAKAMADIPPLQLDQALTHLLRNARQAVRDTQRITVRTWNTQSEVLVQVRDDGVGIPKENLRRVFEPFFTTRGVGKGIGLGLTAAYGIVKRVGGEIDVESEGAGRGATFTLKLPRIDVAQPLSNVA